MNKKTIRDVDVKGKKVLVRCDFNVPLDENKRITDNTRITAALPTIKYLMGQGAKVILCSHLGRPKGEVNEKYSLQPVADELTDLLDTDVKFASDVTGSSARSTTESLSEGDVALLENVRFDPREERNDDTLAMELASLSDGIYVNDAFGTAHRAHASTEGVTRFLEKTDENGEKTGEKGEAVAGLLMEKEIEFIGGTLDDPSRPLIAVLGGSKVSDKIGVIDNLIDVADEILIGGGMAYTFLKAQGYNIGDSICEEDKVKDAKRMMDKAKKAGKKIVLPKDFNVTSEFSNDTPNKIVDVDKIPDGYQGLDIGPKTVMEFSNELQNAETVLWNGPLGVCEFTKYAIGTERVAEAIANTDAVSVVGGGDSVAAIKKLGLADRFTHISTGGGATLELLEGKTLPGLAALTDRELQKKGEKSEKKQVTKSIDDSQLR